MRPAWLYGIGVGFVAVWVAAGALGVRWAEALDPAVQLPLFKRALLQGTALTMRAMPFMVVAGFMLPPVVTLAAAWLVRPGENGLFRIREAVVWLVVWVASWAMFLGLAQADLFSPWMLVLVWSGGIAQALLVAIAFQEQRRLREMQVTRIPSGVVLGAGILLQVLTLWGGFLAAGIPLLSGWVNPPRRPTRG